MGHYKRMEIERQDRELAERKATIDAMYRCIYGLNVMDQPDVLMNERRTGFNNKSKGEY